MSERAAKRMTDEVGAAPAAEPVTLKLVDGAQAVVDRDTLELRDPEGRLLLRYADGHAELSVPHGDLILAAPHGQVRIASGKDVQIEAARDMVCKVERRFEARVGDDAQLSVEPDAVRVATPKLEVEAVDSAFTTDAARVVARVVTTSAHTLATRVERYELEAAQLVERSRNVYRDVAELLQSRVGRVRAIVKDVYSLSSRRTVMTSEQDTSIDGERILLG